MAQAMYNVWLEKPRYDAAERLYQEHLQMLKTGGCSTGGTCVSSHPTTSGGADHLLQSRIDAVEKENKELRKAVEQLHSSLVSLTNRVSTLEKSCSQSAPAPVSAAAVTKKESEAAEEEEDDDFELFGSDDEASEEEAERVRQERVKAYEAKKANKPAAVAKSNIILDVKPWDDETDMANLEECVRSIEMDGLLWGASKFVPLAYGIKKLQISCVVEDDKVSTDDLEEQIVAFEDYIQSMDIAAFNKI